MPPTPINPKDAEKVRELLIGTVPQWYRAEAGPFGYALRDTKKTFYSTRKLTPSLEALYRWMNTKLGTWAGSLPDFVTPSVYAQITEEVALQWLRIHSTSVSWARLIGHLEELRLMTHENAPVARNIIISPTEEGQVDITAGDLLKGLAGFAASTHTFLRVDGELRYVGYEEIGWTDVKEVDNYKFHPDFLHPFHCKVGKGEFSAHLTNRGDIVILSQRGLLTAKRRGRWYVYDVETFKNFVSDTLGSYRVGCNVFDILFDLSYRRHGALLVYDPHGKVIKQVSNKSSIIGEDQDALRSTVGSEIAGIGMGSTQIGDRKKRLFLEAASMDGSIIFNKTRVLAFGAFVKTHPEADAFLGTRATAAHSAFLWGGTAVKVSADGDIQYFFRSTTEAGVSEARKAFL